MNNNQDQDNEGKAKEVKSKSENLLNMYFTSDEEEDAVSSTSSQTSPECGEFPELSGFVPNQDLFNELRSCGVSALDSKRALYKTGNTTLKKAFSFLEKFRQSAKDKKEKEEETVEGEKEKEEKDVRLGSRKNCVLSKVEMKQFATILIVTRAISKDFSRLASGIATSSAR